MSLRTHQLHDALDVIDAQQLRINELVAELAAKDELIASLTKQVLYEGHRADHNWNLFTDLAVKVLDKGKHA
jgi:hypothetical protein